MKVTILSNLVRNYFILASAFLFLLLSSAYLQAQEGEIDTSGHVEAKLLQEAEDLEKEGNFSAATSKYRMWLERNKDADSSIFTQIVLKAASIQEDAGKAMKLLKDFTPAVQNAQYRNKLVHYRALLLEMLGRIEEAALLYQEVKDSDLMLYKASLLLFEQGLFKDAETKLREILYKSLGFKQEPELGARANHLLAKIYTATGRKQEAEAIYLLLLKRFPDNLSAPAFLLSYFEFLLAEGEVEEADEVLEILKKRFPKSPEYSLAGQVFESSASPTISYASSPSRLLSQLAAETLEDAAQPEAKIDAQPDTPREREVQIQVQKVLVQTGSFRNPENARYMVLDLQNRGFSASIRETVIQNTRYYRVVIGPEQTPEEAQTLLIRLKDSGFEGVLLFLD